VWHDEGPARRLVHALKYDGWTVAAVPMAEAVARFAPDALRRAELLVPVPLGRTRLRERGHNQAGLLADALAARSGSLVAHDVLLRRRETRTQTDLAPDARRRNVSGAFAPGPRSARGLVVALVDDVLTTGATLGAAAVALARAGAREVGAVTFARAAVPR
jgi:ComF family protein